MCLNPPLEAVFRGYWLRPQCIHDGVNSATSQLCKAKISTWSNFQREA